MEACSRRCSRGVVLTTATSPVAWTVLSGVATPAQVKSQLKHLEKLKYKIAYLPDSNSVGSDSTVLAPYLSLYLLEGTCTIQCGVTELILPHCQLYFRWELRTRPSSCSTASLARWLCQAKTSREARGSMW